MPYKKNDQHERQWSARPSFSSMRTSSTTHTLSTVKSSLADNATEPYAGVASDIIPSSIVSFHHPHSLADYPLSRQSTRDSRRMSVTSSNFRFFTNDQISHAEGVASTYENADYDNDWDETPLYEYAGPSDESFYGSLDRHSSRRDGESSVEDLVFEQADLSPDNHDKLFGQSAKLRYQRFYIAEEDLVVGIAGYKTSKHKLYLYYALCVCSLGLFYLLLRWVPRYRVKMYGETVPLGKAEWCVFENEFGELSIIDVKRDWYNRSLSTVLHTETDVNLPVLISMEYRFYRLIYSPVDDVFKTNSNWTDSSWSSLSHQGLTKDLQEDRVLAFGRNSTELKEKTTMEILFDEALHPFYIFQVFSIILWSMDSYYYYAGCIFLISLVSIINTLIETKQSMARLTELSHFDCQVRVYRNEFWNTADASDLVPGDIFEISDPSLSILPCDAVLLSGDCIVNESMLTGESVPVSKVPASRETMQTLFHDFHNSQITSALARSFLFNGTKIVRVRATDSVALAQCVRTGFSTTKGALVRSMLFPKPVGFKFYEDSFKYIGFMTIIAFLGFIISAINFVRLGLEWEIIVLRALDIITIVVPPALPATLSIGTNFALGRLKKRSIFCIAPTRVNVGGQLNLMAFDKTGTLTEDGLSVLGVHVGDSFSELVTDVRHLASGAAKRLLLSLATCHALRVVDDELIGDPLDQQMFEFTGWNYDENRSDTVQAVATSQDNEQFGVVRSFEFISELRRMSVVVKPHDGPYIAFTKGAPEVVSPLCHSIPEEYEELLHHYTHSGYRVIACAGKRLGSSWMHTQKASRDEIESGLEFLGFIVFENKLKPATAPTLAKLKDANIRTVMCTGDNILTAISVGRECGMIGANEKVFIPIVNDVCWDAEPVSQGVSDDLDPITQSVDQNNAAYDTPYNATGRAWEGITWHNVDDESCTLNPVTLKPASHMPYCLAVTGEVFRALFKSGASEEYINEVLLHGTIFARMSPDEKHELVEQLQGLDYTVGFCGDGANDCGALKAADVGISLSEAEASVAAPFTSRVFDISCVVEVIKEGRASLVTSFSCFQYMSLYSAIQFVSVTILYSRGSNLGDFQFLYIDLVLILPIAIFMSWSKPYETLAVKRPGANLVSPKILIPLVVSILTLLVFQVAPWLAVQSQPWYQHPIVAGDDAVQSSDNTVLFFVSNFQYILTAVVLSVGPPYREPMSKNKGFIWNVIFCVVLCLVLMNIDVSSYVGELLQLTWVSPGFKLFISFWAIVNYVALIKIPPMFSGLMKKSISKKRFKQLTAKLHV